MEYIQGNSCTVQCIPDVTDVRQSIIKKKKKWGK